ncbi:hypothetical protein GUJ93_ZPchr0005g16193 [Zizania palustris]|uniref:Uncharacterized protein n=1 Tax=Zizania palustris TaxID=103762 RepID=A0A8J5SX87_ZIZPA|nr:hypothetical protein GUJ93_ZPchr0005g16193 [Zizania palustris]
MGVRRPSSPAPQRPSTRERRPVTRDSIRKPPEVATPCQPSTSERHPATSHSPEGKSSKLSSWYSRNQKLCQRRVELQVDGKHKASSVNFPPRKMLTSNVEPIKFSRKLQKCQTER